MLFPQGKSSNNRAHFRYYEQGLYYSQELSAESSLLGVCALLTQCFFLLAVCLTDRYRLYVRVDQEDQYLIPYTDAGTS